MNKKTGDGNVCELVQSHLSSMWKLFHSCFPNLSKLGTKLMPNPFIVEVCFLLERVNDD